MNTVSHELAATTVLNRSGDPVRFGDLYCDATTLIVFVRHFGCIFCRERIAELTEAVPLLAEAGVQTVVIGNGTALMANAFAEELALDVPLYTDPSRKTYELAGMQRNFGLGLKTVGHALRSWRSGHRQGPVAGDVWQQGGVLVVNPDSRILEAYYDRGAGDYIDLANVVERLKHKAA